MIELFLQRFQEKYTADLISGQSKNRIELSVLYREIIQRLGTEYAVYREYYPRFIKILEQNTTAGLIYGIDLFTELYQDLFTNTRHEKLDTSVLEHQTDEALMKMFFQNMEDTRSKGVPIRISEQPFDFSEFGATQKESIVSSLVKVLQDASHMLNWDNQKTQTLHMLLIPLHQLLVELDHTEIFYHNAGVFTERSYTSANYQPARNVVEEILIAAFRDGLPEFGFFNALKLYTNIPNVNAALINGCISLALTKKSNRTLSDKYAQDIVSQGIKLFRNARFYPWAKMLYENQPTGLDFSDFNRRSIDLSYFYCLLKVREQNLPGKLGEYLSKERESMFSNGIREAQPWLILLLQVKNAYPTSGFELSGLQLYLKIFESIVPPENIEKQRRMIEAESPEIIRDLKELLVKLKTTSDKDDFVHDNEHALTLSNRVIVYSYENKDVSGFLLAMFLKSDYSVLFQSKTFETEIPFILEDIDFTELDEMYDDPAKLLGNLTQGDTTCIFWLAIVENTLYQLSYFNGEFEFYKPTNWSFKAYQKLRNEKYFLNLGFKHPDPTQDPTEIFKEQLNQSSLMTSQLLFTSLKLPVQAKAFYLVKDMMLAQLPHNLLLNEGAFKAHETPFFNILSTEWKTSRKRITLQYPGTKTIWIPIESQDQTIRLLYKGLDHILIANQFIIHKAPRLTAPLSSDINVICAHGAEDISDLPVFYFGSERSFLSNNLTGEGKVLVLFVCYGGSEQTQLFKNEVSSLVKRYITAGYETVIAPAWSLDITVAIAWLPLFLESLASGQSVGAAYHAGIKKVRLQFPTPAAWACLHFYGNPDLKYGIGA